MKAKLKEPYNQFFGTLANQVRLDIIKYLITQNNNVNEIVKAVGKNQSTISHSLKRLECCGFVTCKKDGKNRIYSLNKKTIKPLFELMENHMEVYCKKIIEK
tara:strand:+ start:234 stop:539 length:306 start_codon:yes stop_codon:yes gene_type:complete